MQGGRNLPRKTAFTTHRVPRRHVEPSLPTRSADEALLNFVLGRSPEPAATTSTDPGDSREPTEE